MEKINFINNNLEYNKSDNFEIEFESKSFVTIKMKIKKNSNIIFNIENNNEVKILLFIDLLPNITLKFTEIKKGNKLKFQNKINLNENSSLNITKLHDIDSINESCVVNLNGINAKIDYILKTVSKNQEKYDINITHNAINTNSNITTNGVNILNGKLSFIVTTYVNNGMIKSIINQENKIINLTDNNCKIQPNLLIEELDTIANHAALIKNFSDSDLFYLRRLGINCDDAKKLLIKGFLQNKVNKSLSEQLFSKYWRIL